MNLFIETPYDTAAWHLRDLQEREAHLCEHRRHADREGRGDACDADRGIGGERSGIRGGRHDREELGGDCDRRRSDTGFLSDGRVGPAAGGHAEFASERMESAAHRAESAADRGSYSLEQETYRKELAFDRRRSHRRRLRGALRALAFVMGVPLVLAFAFVASYLLTCILDGATPQECVQLLQDLGARIVEVAGSFGAM